MNNKNRLFYLSMLFMLLLGIEATAKEYTYESVPGDPLKARIYTLDNGLKVYMTVNDEAPRIQTYIAVRVGGKNDPAETTGLAHYFEHLMFKGTDKFGTSDYKQEVKLLDQIEEWFEIYRATKDEEERKAIYRTIDSLSYEASRYAIPNEYDKLMSAIGAEGTNAYTSFDATVYIEDIPSNQIENWAKIQADRFENNVIRGFHTELETVYEEKNMSLTRDFWKIYNTMFAALFPHHPYGTQTILGTQEHLKNPSITNIKEYFKIWYVPNNMAICLSGDFDPEEMIVLIDNYFGHFKPNPDLPVLQTEAEQPITSPIVKEILGPDAENVTLAWRAPGSSHPDYEGFQLLSQILYNGKAGLIDVDLIQQQKILSGFGGMYDQTDYSTFIVQGRPKQEQTLDEVKELMYAEIQKLKAGEFDEKVLEATINNFKRYQLLAMETNEGRAGQFVEAFINGIDWKDEVASLYRMSKITKEQIVGLANKYLGENNYALLYKRQGQDPDEKKIDKPEITPMMTNRDLESDFLKEVKLSPVNPIQPVFLDYDRDVTKLEAKHNLPVLYRQNTTSDLFQLRYIFDMGNNQDRMLGTAFSYLRYLGTEDMTLEEINSEFYRLACSFNVQPGNTRTYVSLTGLNENMPQALQLFEKLMEHAVVNQEAYANLAEDIIKRRENAKLNQAQNFSALFNYALWGTDNPSKNILSAQELRELDPELLVDKVRNMSGYKHRIMYYGPSSGAEIVELINRYHRIPGELKEVPEGKQFAYQPTDRNRVLIAPYEAKQIYLAQLFNTEKTFDINREPLITLYNEYFGGSMNSIVFQEMREVRGLAYSAWASVIKPPYLEYPYYIRAQIATQNDKMTEAIETFEEIINNMPQSEAAFNIAKEGLISRLQTERITKDDIIWSYIQAQDLGLTEDRRIRLYEAVRGITLEDVVKYQQENVRDRNWTYCILGDEQELDMEVLEKIAPIERLTPEDIFGY